MKTAHFLKRHPFFYTVRFYLTIAKSSKDDFEIENCNKYLRKSEIPKEFLNELNFINFKDKNGSFEQAKSIISYMNITYGKGPGLGYNSVENLKKLKKSNVGVCSDYSNVFTALCLAKDLKVREWGLVRRLKYDRNEENLGHTFNEIFCDKLNKWIIVDPYFGFGFKDLQSGLPMGAKEYLDSFHSTTKIEKCYFINNRKFTLARLDKINELYSPKNIFFLLKRYNVFRQDKFLKLINLRVPIPLIHVLMIFTKNYHSYLIYCYRENREYISMQLKLISLSPNKCI